MASPISPNNSVRRHGRNISHPMPRRNTKGPLDSGDDPLAEAPPQSPQVASPTGLAQPGAANTSLSQSLAPSQIAEIAPARPMSVSVDLRFLLDRRIYHQIPTDDIASAFLESSNQPPLETPLAALLENGHFRRAAEAALRGLFQSKPNQAEHILNLLYTRLACLVIIGRPDLAADEALPLTDFFNRGSPASKDLIEHFPWELRLILVRLQSIVAADGGRRAIMGLYNLTAQVRSHLHSARAAGDLAATQTWSDRLQDLGLRVADSLVEMGELETATRHLDTLLHLPTEEILSRKTLLRIRVGDIPGASNFLASLSSSTSKDVLSALLQTAGGDFETAVATWKALTQQQSGDELLGQNLAVCLLYTGRMTEAREILEGLARDAQAFPALLFNLTTVYELCTERAVERKGDLARHVASKTPGVASGGWERLAAEFKL